MPKPLKVLILEDNPDDAEMVLRELRQSGYEPDWQRTEDAEGFLKLLEEPFDLILADYSMPQFDAPRALELLKESGRDLPFIMVSGTVGEEIAVESMKLGAADYLLKDRLKRLGHAVERVLEQKRLREERRLTLRALEDSERKFRSLVRNSGDGIVLADERGLVIEWNMAQEAIMGVSRADALGQPLWEIFTELLPEEQQLIPQRHEIQAAVQEALNKGHSPWINQLEAVKIRTTNGEERFLETRVFPIQTERGYMLGGVTRDVTISKRNEERLTFQARLLDSVRESLIASDLEGRVTYWSKGAEEQYGYSAEEALGQPITELIVTREDEESELARIRYVLEHGVWSGRYRQVRRTGEIFWSDTVISLAVDRSGQPFGMIGIDRDITEQVEAQEELRKSEEKHRTLFETMAHGVVYQGSSGEIVEANPAAARILGLSPEQLQGRTSFDPRWHAIREDGSEYSGDQHPSMVALRSGKEVTNEIMGVFNPQSETYRWINIHAVPLFRPGEARAYQVYTTFEDITQLKEAEQQQAEYQRFLTSLNEITHQALGNDDLPDTLQTLVDHIAELFDAQASYLTFWDPERQLPIPMAAYGPMRETYASMQIFPEETNLTASVLSAGRALVIENLSESEHISPAIIQRNKFPHAAGIGLPMIAGEQRLGAVILAYSDPRAFSAELVAQAEQAVAQIALTIAKTRAVEAAQRRAVEAETLRQAAEAVSSLNQQEAIDAILEQLAQVVTYESATVQLLRSDHLENVGGRGWQDLSEVIGVRFPIPGDNPNTLVIESGQALIVENAPREYPAFNQDSHKHILSWLGVPLIVRERVTGMLALDSRQKGFFSPEDARLASAFANQVAVALDNARLYEDTRRNLERVQALHAIDLAISASMDLKFTLDILLEQVIKQMRVDAADVLLLDSLTQRLELVGASGLEADAWQAIELRTGDVYAGQAVLDRTLVTWELYKDNPPPLRADLFARAGFVAYCAVPLIAKGEVKGVLEVYSRNPIEFDPDWTDFLGTLAGQAAIAVDNAELFNNLQRSNIDLVRAYDSTLEGWARALELRDKETEGHSRRVTEMTLRLAREMGMLDEELLHVRRGALLHDIGKMGMPDSILLKPGPLNEEEWAIMRMHTIYAYQLLSPIAYLRPALDIPYCHHEKWDGAGYPRGLKGAQIPLAARIFAIVDVWDALSSDRPYRPAWSEEKVLSYLKEQAGAHFDPRVVEKFIQLLPAAKAEGLSPGTPKPAQSVYLGS